MKSIKVSYNFFIRHEKLIKFFCKIFKWHIQNEKDYYEEIEKMSEIHKTK